MIPAALGPFEDLVEVRGFLVPGRRPDARVEVLLAPEALLAERLPVLPDGEVRFFGEAGLRGLPPAGFLRRSGIFLQGSLPDQGETRKLDQPWVSL